MQLTQAALFVALLILVFTLVSSAQQWQPRAPLAPMQVALVLVPALHVFLGGTLLAQEIAYVLQRRLVNTQVLVVPRSQLLAL